MVRGLMVLLLMLLVGNPFCCCAFGHAMTAEESSLPDCCRAKFDVAMTDSPAAPVSEEDLPVSCPCLKEPSVVAPSELLLPVSRVSTPAPSRQVHGPALLPAAREMSREHLLHPGRYGPEATAPPFRLLYGVFRC